MVGVIVFLQILELSHFIRKTNRIVSRFLNSIAYNDFSFRFRHSEDGKSFEELQNAFKTVADKFQQVRIQKEEQYLFLQTLVEHVKVGLLSFREDGHVFILNAEAKKLLQIPHLLNVHSLNRIKSGLGDQLLVIHPGEKLLVKLVRDDEYLQLVVHATAFKKGGERHTLLSLQHIGRELEEKEVESWQKLIRVLTHEIMNSITPIMSLAGTARQMLQNVPQTVTENTNSDEFFDDLHEAVSTIESRSRGMLQFVEAYRKLNRVPQPEFQYVEVQKIFQHLQQLMRTKTLDKNIDFQLKCEPQNLRIYADAELIEQVLINLLVNAFAALQDVSDPQIILKAYQNSQHESILMVKDNGPGINKELLDKIFIPFFTTKAEGSGIGLSICRQIVRAHHGEINVITEEGKGAEFRVRLPLV